jgi:hypothetical protein
LTGIYHEEVDRNPPKTDYVRDPDIWCDTDEDLIYEDIDDR